MKACSGILRTPETRRRRQVASALALAAALLADRAGAGGTWPDSSMTATVALGPSAGVGGRLSATTPRLGVGSIALRVFGSTDASGNGAGSSRAGFAVGGRAECNPTFGMAWLGAAWGRSTSDTEAVRAPIFDAGMGTRLAGVIVMARARLQRVAIPRDPVWITSWTAPPGFHSPPDIIPTLPYLEKRAPYRASITALETRLQWARGGWDLEGEGGWAVGLGIVPIPLARGQATRWVASSVGLAFGMSAGVPGWMGEGLSDHQEAWLGVRFEPEHAPSPRTTATMLSNGPRRWMSLGLGGDHYALRLHAPGHASVALRGDFTDWQPVALERIGGGWWEVRIDVPPGVHQLEISVDDGAWCPPPGVITAPGLYGGEVGTFVAE